MAASYQGLNIRKLQDSEWQDESRPEPDRHRKSATRDRRAFRCGQAVFESVSALRIGAIARAYTAVLSVATHAQVDVLKRSRRSRETLVHGRQEAPYIQGLRQVRPNAGVQQPPHSQRERVGAEHDHGDVARARVVTEKTEHLVAGDIREVTVEQDQVRSMVSSEIDSHPTLHRRQHGRAGAARQDALDESEVR